MWLSHPFEPRWVPHVRSSTKALGVDTEFIVASDKKKLAQQWLVQKSGATHVLRSGHDHMLGCGRCERHLITCSVEAFTSDLLTAGLPCHPFSKMRFQEGHTINTQAPEMHEEFAIVVEFPLLLRRRKPGGCGASCGHVWFFSRTVKVNSCSVQRFA